MRDKEAEKQLHDSRHKEKLQGFLTVAETMQESIEALIKFLDGKTTETVVKNQIKNFATPQDIKQVVAAVTELKKYSEDNQLDLSPIKEAFETFSSKLDELPKSFPEIPEAKDEVKISNLGDIDFATLEKSITDAVTTISKSIKAPVVNVPETQVLVDAPDLEPLEKPLKELLTAFKAFKVEVPQTDLSKVEKKLDKSNELLTEISKIRGGGGGGGGHGTPYVDSTGKHAYVELDNGAIPITGTINATPSTLADFSTNDIEEAATSYFGKTKPDGTWLVQKLTDTSVSYATATNNGSVTTYTEAWTNRATLTYGRFDQAF